MRYAIGLGANRRTRWGSPTATIEAASAELRLIRRSRIHGTAPLGPSIRRFANAAAILETTLSPPALLA